MITGGKTLHGSAKEMLFLADLLITLSKILPARRGKRHYRPAAASGSHSTSVRSRVLDSGCCDRPIARVGHDLRWMAYTAARSHQEGGKREAASTELNDTLPLITTMECCRGHAPPPCICHSVAIVAVLVPVSVPVAV